MIQRYRWSTNLPQLLFVKALDSFVL